MKERLVIIVVALIAGLFITSAGFFIYQSTKKVTDTNSPKKIATNSGPPQEIDQNRLFIKISEPVDESITSKRTIQIKGITNPENTIVISSNLQDVTGKPTQDGNFSVTIDISAGANILVSRSVSPTGESVEDKRTITYSTEEF